MYPRTRQVNHPLGSEIDIGTQPTTEVIAKLEETLRLLEAGESGNRSEAILDIRNRLATPHTINFGLGNGHPVNYLSFSCLLSS